MRPVEQLKAAFQKTPLITNVTRRLWTKTLFVPEVKDVQRLHLTSKTYQLLKAATFKNHCWKKKTRALKTYLFQSSTLGANKSHAEAIIDIGGHWSHAIPAFCIKCVPGHQLRAAKGLVDVQTAEGVINRDRLQEEKGQARVSSLLCI